MSGWFLTGEKALEIQTYLLGHNNTGFWFKLCSTKIFVILDKTMRGLTVIADYVKEYNRCII